MNTFTIITEDGEQKLTVPEYHTRKDLMAKVGLVTTPPEGRRTLFMGTTIVSYPIDYLESNPKKESLFREIEDAITQNPLKYFVPQDETARMFLNDRDHGIKGICAGNGYGKSTVGWIDVLLDIIPCDPSWPIFTNHGVEHRRYKGPMREGGVAMVSYEWINHINTTWPQVIRRWTPKEFIEDFKDGDVQIAWQKGPKVVIAGTNCQFLACSQAQGPFEASALNIFWWDEQGEEQKFNGANARIRRRHGRHVMTLTPHKIEGRPDTGAGGWIEKLFTGEMTGGHRVKFYQADILGLPDWIYGEQAKKDAIKEWIEEPMATGNARKYREGLSRIYGRFHETSSLVFEDFSERVHLIDPIPIEDHWTRYRAVDHGRVNPTAMLEMCVTDKGDVIFFNEYYEAGKQIDENAEGIIRKCGNKRILVEKFEDRRGRMTERWEEVGPYRYRKSLIDSRSAGKQVDNGEFTIGQLYALEGLRCTPATGQPFEVCLPIVRQYFKQERGRRHIQTGEDLAPRVYFFRNLVHTIHEIRHYRNEEVVRASKDGSKNISERPKGKDDHLMTCMIWLLMERPAYIETFLSVASVTEEDEKETTQSLLRDPITGY